MVTLAVVERDRPDLMEDQQEYGPMIMLLYVLETLNAAN